MVRQTGTRSHDATVSSTAQDNSCNQPVASCTNTRQSLLTAHYQLAHLQYFVQYKGETTGSHILERIDTGKILPTQSHPAEYPGRGHEVSHPRALSFHEKK